LCKAPCWRYLPVCLEHARSLRSSHLLTPFTPHTQVINYLEYVRSRRVVSFKKLGEPSESGIQLDLNRELDYEQVRNPHLRPVSR
jgi:hypothetical protein